MARPDQIEQLDRRIAAAVDSAVRDFRNQLAERVRTAGAELSRAVDSAVPVLPPSFLSHGDLEPIVGHDREAAKDGALHGLLEGARTIDEARSQEKILEALLRAAALMSSRAGIFLIRADELRGWRGAGIGDGIQSLDMLRFDIGETPWTDLASGTGCVALSAGDCARIGSRLEAPLAQSGALIPLILRDQVAAVLYADRLDDRAPWSLDALQLLTHLTALAIETLPFRQRPQTPTLRGFGSGAGLGMWTGTMVESGASADSTAVDAAPEITVTETLQTVAAVPSPASPAADDDDLWPPEEEPIAALPFEEKVPPTPRWSEPAPPASPPPTAQPAAAAAGPADTFPAERPAVETSDAYWLLEDAVPGAPATLQAAGEPESIGMGSGALGVKGFEPLPETSLAEMAGASPDEHDEEAMPGAMEPPPIPAFDWSPAAHSAQDASQVELPTPPIMLPMPPMQSLPLATVAIPAPVPAPLAAPPPMPSKPPAAPVGPVSTTSDDDATLLLQRQRYSEPAPAPRPVPPYGASSTATPDDTTNAGMRTVASTTSPIPVPPPVKTWQPGETAEVAPPADLQGPGWAFATSRVPLVAAASGEDQAVHDEARRLARLLVSEIKLYNEERVEDGRRNRDLYERLKEDIDRSRQMYEERVDARVSKNTDYFYQELVRILAAGDAKALGI